jgi:hypothetical protein
MCPIGFLWALPCKTCRAIRPPHADQPAAGGEPRCTPAPTNQRSSRAPGLSWSATRSSWHCPTTSRRRRPGPNRRLGWPSKRLRQLRDEAPTQADHEPGMDAAGNHADPGHPPIRLPAHAALQDLTSAGHSGRGNAQIPDAHTGRRTADTWRSDARTGHWTPVPWTGKRGHWSLAPDTGHRTLAEDADRVTTARPASGPSWTTTPSDRTLGRPTVFLWTAPAALDSPCRLGGEAAFQREIASRRQLLGRSAGVERRLGALLS